MLTTSTCSWSRARRVFHDPACQWVDRIAPPNHAEGTRADAEGSGRRPCKVCVNGGLLAADAPVPRALLKYHEDPGA